MKFNKVDYKNLNAKQKENYNFHFIAYKLAECGYNSIRLTDDYKGADFIAIHIDGDQMLKVQIKGRFTIDKKYIDKNVVIAFIENNIVKIYNHDDAIKLITANISESTSWKESGIYHWSPTPKFYNNIIIEL